MFPFSNDVVYLYLSVWTSELQTYPSILKINPVKKKQPGTSVKNGSELFAGMERVKFAKYANACWESNIRFIPFVFFTFEGDRFFQQPDFDMDLHLGTLYMQQLQMVLRRETARMLLHGQAGYTSVDAAGEPLTLHDLLDDCARLWAGYPQAGAEEMSMQVMYL